MSAQPLAPPPPSPPSPVAAVPIDLPAIASSTDVDLRGTVPCAPRAVGAWRVEPQVVWDDFRVGFFWDRVERTLNLCPFPMVRVKLSRAGAALPLDGSAPKPGISVGFRTGLGLTLLIALAATWAAGLPGFKVLGPLSTALIIALLWKGAMEVPGAQRPGFAFAAKKLLRWGIILLGVRLNFVLVANAGPKVFALDVAVIVFGMFLFTWICRRVFGLERGLSLLIAVGSSICGASAIIAAAPVVRAREDETAISLVLVTLLGTVAAVGLTLANAVMGWTPQFYGVAAGASLHEVAQVLAAVAAAPAALEIGTVTKLIRVALLAPVIFALVAILARRHEPVDAGAAHGRVPFPWFVVGFVVVGIFYTLALKFLPGQIDAVRAVGKVFLTVAVFLMTMGMAGLGLQVDYARLREHGLRALTAATLGWFVLLAFVLFGCWALRI